MNGTFQALNGLTARWVAEVSDGTVFSAAGCGRRSASWRTGPGRAARARLAEAAGAPADQAAYRAWEFTVTLAGTRGLEPDRVGVADARGEGALRPTLRPP
jgi:hypothetical protein